MELAAALLGALAHDLSSPNWTRNNKGSGYHTRHKFAIC